MWLQVDGGVSAETIERCAEAGADVFVAGSAVYSADDPDATVRALRALAEAARRADPGDPSGAGRDEGPVRAGRVWDDGRDEHARPGVGASPNRR